MDINTLDGILKMYTPIIKAPEEYQNCITYYVNNTFNKKIIHLDKGAISVQFSNKNVNDALSFLRLTEHNSDIYIKMRNRVENNLVDKLASAYNQKIEYTYNTIKNMVEHCLYLNDMEETALLNAYKENPSDISSYIYFFYSLKIWPTYNYLNYDMYKELQLSMFTIIDKYNGNINKYKPMPGKYFMFNVLDNYLQIVSKYNGYNVNSNIMRDFRKISKISDVEWKKLNYKELAQKYNISKNNIKIYQYIKTTVNLDEIINNNEDDDNKKINIEPSVDVIDNVDRKILLNEFAKQMSKEEKLQEEMIYKILNAVLVYKEKHNERIKISVREKIDLSQQIDISYNTLDKILNEFGKWFG